MRVLNVTQSYYPFLDQGGPTVKVRALAHGIAATGNRVSVLTADLGLDAEKQKLAEAKLSDWGFEAHTAGVETIYLRTLTRYRSLTWNPDVSEFCRKRLPAFDAVHIFGLYDLIGPPVAKACRRLGLPYVVEPMGMFQPIVRSIFLKRVYLAILGRPMLDGAARIIATAEQEREELIAGGVADNQIVVRRNGIDAPESTPAAGRFREQWNIPPNAKLILFLGRLVSKKSPDLMIDAFAAWQKRSAAGISVLVLAGPDESDGYRKRLESQASDMSLNGAVLFTGPLYGEDKWAAYRDADLFVLPSQNENFGNTAAEAVACGTPVLVTDRCGIAPIVDGKAGIVVPHDCAAIEAGLRQILDDPDCAARLRAGCEGVARSLGWAEPLAEMESLYRQLISEKRNT